jgi:drug/metabolite transporter (DMT)-like permease
MLVLTTLFWGLSFPLMKNWLDATHEVAYPGGGECAGLTLIGIRVGLALLILAVFQPRLFSRPTWREWRIGLALGALNAPGLALQIWGLDLTSPALNVFLTSVASAWVPLLGFSLFRNRVAPLTLLGLGVGLAGVAVLGIRTDGEAIDAGSWRALLQLLGPGEWLTLASSVLFAIMILLIDRWGKHAAPGHLTIGFLAGTGLPLLAVATGTAAAGPGLRAWVSTTTDVLAQPKVLIDVTLLTIFPTVLAWHWLNIYQPRVPATRAALIYLLEPVFGSLFSLAWGLDTLTQRLVLGGALILGGNFLVELPAWLRDRRKRWTGGTYRVGTEGEATPPA